MVNKRSFFAYLAQACIKLDIPREKLIIVSGGACIIHGIRKETRDIDVVVTDYSLLDKFKAKGYDVKYYEPIGLKSGIHIMDIHNVSFIWYDKINPNMQATKYRGYYLLTKESLLLDKVELGRSKDLPDIKKLSQYSYALDSKMYDRLSALIQSNKQFSSKSCVDSWIEKFKFSP